MMRTYNDLLALLDTPSSHYGHKTMPDGSTERFGNWPEEQSPAASSEEPAAAPVPMNGSHKLPIASDSERCSNYTGFGDDKSAKPINVVVEGIKKVTNPMRVGGSLFFHDKVRDIYWVRSAAQFFGYVQAVAGKVFWERGNSFVTKEEAMAEVIRQATGFDSIERLPHEPAIEGIYYTNALPAGNDDDVATFERFLDFFAPASPFDRQLIKALAMTLFWGGPPGKRPMFSVTAGGRGQGKTVLATMIADLAGGSIDFGAHEDEASIKKRLLSPDAIGRRMCLIDNAKSLKLSSSSIEALITAPVVSGHKLYEGNATRPNYATWVVTVNGASYSRDFAQRAVNIQLREPAREGDWYIKLTEFVKANRQRIIAGVLRSLQMPVTSLEAYSRADAWESCVLARLVDPVGLSRLIAQRQAEVDSDLEDGSVVADHFATMLKLLGYPLQNRVFIPSAVASEWFCTAIGDRMSAMTAAKKLKQMCDERLAGDLTHCPSRVIGRGFIWNPDAQWSSLPKVEQLWREHKQRQEGERERDLEAYREKGRLSSSEFPKVD